MNGLNKNGRKYFDKVLYNQYNSPGITLAINSLKLLYPEPRYSYEPIEKKQFGDFVMTDNEIGEVYLGEVEARNKKDHGRNMIAYYDEVNITLKHNLEQLFLSGKKGFCISVCMDDLNKEFASEFYVTLLKDIAIAPKKKNPNKHHDEEYFFKLRNELVKRYVLNSQNVTYDKIKLLKGIKDDYYN
jgi:hypothetical protein